MLPQQGIFIINVVLHMICIIPITSPNHIHHSTLRGENSYSTNGENAYTALDEENISNMPYFLKVPRTVSVIEGSTVILSCRIENLANRMVFWIRNSDLQILTAGLMTFTADNRFRVNHENSVDATDWSLLITNVKMEDQGQYECQINTEPKMKLNINLMVKELIEVMEMDSPFSGATIEGKNVDVLQKGSTVTLTCKVMKSEIERNSEERHIEWMRNGEPVNFKTRHGGISIFTDWSSKSGTSRLTLAALEESDEGNYSCTSDGFESEHFLLRVVSHLKGDVAEISMRNNGSTQKSSILIMFLILYYKLL